jgi:uncharacterized protein YjiS (DUF1127 family)
MTTVVMRSAIAGRQSTPRPGLFARILETLATWHDRSVQRRTLAHFSEYQLHDIGLSRSQVSYEIEKPCWRV